MSWPSTYALCGLGVPLTLRVPRKLPNDKINNKPPQSDREEDIIVQSRCNDVNDNLMELLILMSACKTASTRRITRHYPAFSLGADGQGRQLVANMLACAGCGHIITIDLHASQIQRFFDIPAAILINDMMDTGRTLTPAARPLHDKDVKTIRVLISYGSCLRINDNIVTDPMVGLFAEADITALEAATNRRAGEIRAIDISAIIAESIQRTYNGKSIGLFFCD
ncbi:phosphoribosyl pyrophosphokinase [Pisolithus thermaeus]|nr:phosphoribosyl pyrophosphokinase [Pisolithus thermaeus]